MCLIRLEPLYTPMATRWHALANEHRKLLQAIEGGKPDDVTTQLDDHLDMAIRYLLADDTER